MAKKSNVLWQNNLTENDSLHYTKSGSVFSQSFDVSVCQQQPLPAVHSPKSTGNITVSKSTPSYTCTFLYDTVDVARLTRCKRTQK